MGHGPTNRGAVLATWLIPLACFLPTCLACTPGCTAWVANSPAGMNAANGTTAVTETDVALAGCTYIRSSWQVPPVKITQPGATIWRDARSGGGEGGAAVLELCNSVWTVWVQPGSLLQLHNLTLRQALLPSRALLDSGLTPPAPLAFNISGVAGFSSGSTSGSSSGGSGNNATLLLLQGCTVTTSCSNLAPFLDWVQGSLMTGTNRSAVDVQIPAGSSSGTASSSSTWAFFRRLRLSGVEMRDTNLTCDSTPSPLPGSSSGGGGNEADDASSITNYSVSGSDLDPTQPPVAYGSASDPTQLLALVHLAAQQPTTIRLLRSMRIPSDWPGASVVLSWPLVLEGAPPPAPRTVLDLYKVRWLMSLEMGSVATVAFVNVNLMNMCAVHFAPWPTAPNIMYGSSTYVWSVSYSRNFPGILLTNITVSVSEEEFLEGIFGAVMADVVMNTFTRYKVVGLLFTSQQGAVGPQPVLQMNRTHGTQWRGEPSYASINNFTITSLDMDPEDDLELLPLEWCTTTGKVSVYGHVADSPQSMADMLAEMTQLLQDEPSSPVFTAVSFPYTIVMVVNASLADVVQDAGARLQLVGAAANGSSNGSSIGSSNGRVLSPTVGLSAMLYGSKFPLVVGGEPVSIAVDLAGCLGCLPLSSTAAHLYLANMRLNHLEQAAWGWVNSDGWGGPSTNGSSSGAAAVPMALPLWAFGFEWRRQGAEPQVHMHNVTLELPAGEFAAILGALQAQGRAQVAGAAPDGVAAALSRANATLQTQQVSSQAILLSYLEAWGINGSLVTLVPHQQLDSPPPPPPDSSAGTPASHDDGGSSTFPVGAIVGIVVGVVAGMVAVTLLLLFARKRRSSGQDHQVGAPASEKRGTHGAVVQPPPPPAIASDTQHKGVGVGQVAPGQGGATTATGMGMSGGAETAPAPGDSLAPPAPAISSSIPLDLDLTKDMFVSEELLGRGTFGRVYRGRYNNQDVAVKKMYNWLHGDMEEDHIKVLRHEVVTLSRLVHPNIMRVLGAGLQPNQPMCLVTELLTGSLDHVIYSSERGIKARICLGLTEDVQEIPLPCVLRLARDIAAGLAFLHPNTVHRDLKPANVLIAEDGTAKISDFGLARSKSSTASGMYTEHMHAGTLQYMAPECFTNNPSQGLNAQADIWSLGIMIWEMMAGTHPFKGLERAGLIYRMTLLKPSLDPPPRCPPELAALLVRCLSYQPKGRPLAKEVCQDLAAMVRACQDCGADAASQAAGPRPLAGDSSAASSQPGHTAPLPGPPPGQPSQEPLGTVISES